MVAGGAPVTPVSSPPSMATLSLVGQGSATFCVSRENLRGCLLFIEGEGENPRVFSTWAKLSRVLSLKLGSSPGCDNSPPLDKNSPPNSRQHPLVPQHSETILGKTISSVTLAPKFPHRFHLFPRSHGSSWSLSLGHPCLLSLKL